MPEEMSQREAIEKTARNHIDAMKKQGVDLDYEQTRNRISEAVSRGDRKRADRK